MEKPDYLDDLVHFSRTVWGKPQALLKHLPPRDVEYIDLGIYFEAFQRLSSGILAHDKILVRNEYRVALKALQTKTAYRRGAYVVGHPGIGKTYFLIYALVHLLGQRMPVAFQQMGDGSFYILFKDTATVHDIKVEGPLHKCEFVWALTDSNAFIQQPPAVFTGNPNRIRIIQTTSPNANRWKQWSKQLGAGRFIMDIWTKEEIENLAMLLELDIERVTNLSDKWGTVPRTLLRYMDVHDDWDVENLYKTGTQRAILNCASIIGAGVELDSTTTHPSPFYFIRPMKIRVKRKGHDVNVCKRKAPSVSVPTRTLRNMLAEGLRMESNQHKLHFYQTLSQMPETRQAAGFIYEYWFHPFMVQGREIECHWVLQGSDGDIDDKARLPTTLQVTADLAPTQKALKTRKPPYYWRPPSHNFPGVDSAFVYDREIFVFQVTLNEDHESPIDGLKKLQSLLTKEEEEPKKGKCKKRKKQNTAWRVVYVGQEEGQVKQAATQWVGELRSPEDGMPVPVAWSVVDPVRHDMRFVERGDEAASVLEESEPEESELEEPDEEAEVVVQ